MNMFDGWLGLEGPEVQEPTDDLAQWLDDVTTAFLAARTLADTLVWLKDMKGANAQQLRAYVRLNHMRVLSHLRSLGQQAFMLWGVNISLPKGLKEQE
jgi:hypothetical protein